MVTLWSFCTDFVQISQPSYPTKPSYYPVYRPGLNTLPWASAPVLNNALSCSSPIYDQVRTFDLPWPHINPRCPKYGYSTRSGVTYNTSDWLLKDTKNCGFHTFVEAHMTLKTIKVKLERKPFYFHWLKIFPPYFSLSALQTVSWPTSLLLTCPLIHPGFVKDAIFLYNLVVGVFGGVFQFSHDCDVWFVGNKGDKVLP